MKRILTTVGISLLLVMALNIMPLIGHSTAGFTLGHVFADAKSDACAGIGLTGGTGCGDNGVSLNKAISAVINVFSAIVGIAGVIMVIIAGYKFITSGGDPSKVASAKSTITYAIIGLVVAALAQAIVHFFLNATK